MRSKRCLERRLNTSSLMHRLDHWYSHAHIPVFRKAKSAPFPFRRDQLKGLCVQWEWVRNTRVRIIWVRATSFIAPLSGGPQLNSRGWHPAWVFYIASHRGNSHRSQACQ
eukprot:1156275-Pelagomonas_calceolata.AAC.4